MSAVNASAIACIGWGSLTWDPRDLPCRGSWNNDGPLLPIEFARESGAKSSQRGDKITLVLCPETPRIRTYWTLLDVADSQSAMQRLAAREGTSETNIGIWDRDNGSIGGVEIEAISAWAAGQDLTAVVWTNLPCKFNGKSEKPSGEEVVAFLRSLDDTRRPAAEGYVRLAPEQIDTPYRRLIERELGWSRR